MTHIPPSLGVAGGIHTASKNLTILSIYRLQTSQIVHLALTLSPLPINILPRPGPENFLMQFSLNCLVIVAILKC